MIKFVGEGNIKEIWAVNVGNSLNAKHHILLLQNHGYICSCLSIIQCEVVCRHYFQVLLTTKNALFHIRLIPSRWYCTKKNGSEEQFLTADKFMQEGTNVTHNNHDLVPYLGLFDQDNKDFREERLTMFEQRMIYGKLHIQESIIKGIVNKF